MALQNHNRPHPARHSSYRTPNTTFTAPLIDRRGPPPGIFQAIHLRMVDDTAALHAVVVSAANDPAGADQHRANRDAARAQPDPRFVYRALEERIDPAV